jgi:hypothetical protein
MAALRKMETGMTVYGEDELRSEEPDGKVKFPAALYIKFGNSLDGYLGYRSLSPIPEVGAPNRDWIRGGPICRPEPLPPEVGPQWKLYKITMDDATLNSYRSDMLADGDGPLVMSNLPDIFGYRPFNIVSARAKNLLERLFPDGSYFLKTDLFDAAGHPVDRPSYKWMPRYSYSYNPTVRPDYAGVGSIGYIQLPFDWEEDMAWELVHLPEVRNYFQGIPFWITGVAIGQVVINAPIFAALKAAKLTGLVENTVTNRLDRKSWENVGHIG